MNGISSNSASSLTATTSTAQEGPISWPECEKILNKWEKEWLPMLGDNRPEAVRKIKNAYSKKSEELNLSGLKLLSPPPTEVLATLPFLKTLDLSDNYLTELPDSLFNKQVNLEKLSLSFNKLHDLPPNIFKPLVNIKKISLGNNYLDEYKIRQQGTFDGLVHLRDASFNHNRPGTSVVSEAAIMKRDAKLKIANKVDYNSSFGIGKLNLKGHLELEELKSSAIRECNTQRLLYGSHSNLSELLQYFNIQPPKGK